jgi:hypothetical protein
LVTRGDTQSVTIKSQDAQAGVQGATITLQRGKRASGAEPPLALGQKRKSRPSIAMSADIT